MAGRVEFELWIKDLTGGTLKKFGSAARSVLGGVDKDVRQTRKGLDDLGSITKLRLDTGEIERAKQEVKELKSSFGEMEHGGREGGMMGEFFKGELLFEGARRAAEEGRKQLSEIFGGGMEEGMTKMEMSVMGGDEAGKKLFEDTKTYIKGSMFGPELFDQEKLLMGYGEQANNIVPLMKQMGDISMGNPFKLESLTEVLGKTEQYGKFQQGFMRQLATTGFNPVQEIYRATGKKIDPDDITAAMYKQAMTFATTPGGRFNDMMNKIMQTPGGKEKMLTTNIEMDKHELGEKLLPVIDRFITALEPMIDKLPAFMDELEPPITKLIDGFRELLPYISSFGSGLWDLLKPIGNIFISPEFKGAMKGLLDFGTELEQDLLPLVKGLAGAIKFLLSMLPEDKNAHKAGNLTGYYYADTTGSAAKGLVPDVARMSKMADSLLGSSFGPAKVFDNWKALDQYNQHQAFNQQTATIKAIAMPMLAAAKSAAGKPLKLAGADTADSDAITSGGSRQIIIKDIHIGEKMVNHFTNVKEGAQQVGQVLKEELARIMLGLPGMQ